MANWPDSPEWSDPKTINSGNQYDAADGVLYTDMNKIISNLLYLKQRGGIIPTGTLSIVRNDTYDVTKYASVEVNVPQTGMDISSTTAQASDVLEGKYFFPYNNAPRTEGTIPIRTASNPEFTAKNDSVTFQEGYYPEASTVKIAESEKAKIIPDNIKEGISILGVQGNYAGGGLDINGVINEYEVNAGAAVNAGDFVEFVTKSSSPTYVQPATTRDNYVGVAKTSGTAGQTIEVFEVLCFYTVTVTKTNCTNTAVTSPMKQGDTQTITFTANTTYELPENITVTNCEYTWNNLTGELTITNLTGNVQITVNATAQVTQLITNPLNGVAISSGYTYKFASGFTPTTVKLNGTTSSTSVTKTIIKSDTNQGVYSPDSTVNVSVKGKVTINSYNDSPGYTYTGKLLCTVTFSNGSQEATDTFTAQGSVYYYCFVKGTKISLADGTVKNVEDICYDDNLLVWDFDNARYASASPLWIKQPEKSLYYYKLTFESGRVLKVVGSDGNAHRLFSLDDNAFVYSTQLVGKRVYIENGIDTLKACERIEEEVEFYNIITKYHMNLFAENVLTSCRYSNLYPIKDMRYIREERDIIPYSAYSVPREYYDGLRLGEQKISVSDTNKYVSRLVRGKRYKLTRTNML